MQHSNFEFVRHYHPELFSQLSHAEQLLGGDASCFLLKLRLSLELWSHDFADLRGIKLDKELTLADKLQLLSSHVHFPECYLAQLSALRQLCNQGLHLQRDARGRHVIQDSLSRSQQLNALSCIYNLVLFNVRYVKPDSQLPTYQAYPQFNLQLLLNQAFAGDGDACCQLAQIELQRHGDGKDARYWFEKAVAAGSELALKAVVSWQQGQLPALSFSSAELKQLLAQFLAAKPTPSQCFELARLADALQCHDKATQLYKRAAMAGETRAISQLLSQHKRLSEHDYEQLLAVGVQHKHPQALQTKLLMLLDMDAGAAATLSADTLAEVPRLLLLAKASRVPALPYLQGLWQLRTATELSTTEISPADWAAIAPLLAQGAGHVAAHLRPDVQTFEAAMAAELWPLAGQFAKRAYQQQQHYANKAQLAQTQLDIARLMLHLAEQHSPLDFELNPKQLVQRAAQAGNAEAQQLQVRLKVQAPMSRGQARGVSGRAAAIKVPPLLQQMLRKSGGTGVRLGAGVGVGAGV